MTKLKNKKIEKEKLEGEIFLIHSTFSAIGKYQTNKNHLSVTRSVVRKHQFPSTQNFL
jgi:hypothetical protein